MSDKDEKFPTMKPVELETTLKKKVKRLPRTHGPRAGGVIIPGARSMDAIREIRSDLALMDPRISRANRMAGKAHTLGWSVKKRLSGVANRLKTVEKQYLSTTDVDHLLDHETTERTLSQLWRVLRAVMEQLDLQMPDEAPPLHDEDCPHQYFPGGTICLWCGEALVPVICERCGKPGAEIMMDQIDKAGNEVAEFIYGLFCPGCSMGLSMERDGSTNRDPSPPGTWVCAKCSGPITIHRGQCYCVHCGDSPCEVKRVQPKDRPPMDEDTKHFRRVVELAIQNQSEKEAREAATEAPRVEPFPPTPCPYCGERDWACKVHGGIYCVMCGKDAPPPEEPREGE